LLSAGEAAKILPWIARSDELACAENPEAAGSVAGFL
jgi:hypothetical protein